MLHVAPYITKMLPDMPRKEKYILQSFPQLAPNMIEMHTNGNMAPESLKCEPKTLERDFSVVNSEPGKKNCLQLHDYNDSVVIGLHIYRNAQPMNHYV